MLYWSSITVLIILLEDKLDPERILHLRSQRWVLPHCIHVLTHFLFLTLLSLGWYRDDTTKAIKFVKMYRCYVLAMVRPLLLFQQCGKHRVIRRPDPWCCDCSPPVTRLLPSGRAAGEIYNLIAWLKSSGKNTINTALWWERRGTKQMCYSPVSFLVKLIRHTRLARWFIIVCFCSSGLVSNFPSFLSEHISTHILCEYWMGKKASYDEWNSVGTFTR